ncbi:MAG: GAF domain-containing protein [Deltaproteobacteria bacterium]|nr:GAF domain-containing protein [Deltaproteobacteria bacterium]
MTNISPRIKVLSLVMAALCLLVLASPKNPAYLGVTTHPYLILAVISGALLGLRSSFLATLLIAGMYVFFLIGTADPKTTESILNLQTLTLPFAIVLLPSFLGELTDRLRRFLKQAAERNNQQGKLVNQLEKINTQLQNDKSRCEAHISSQTQTFTRVFEYAQVLESTDTDEICSALVELICDQLDEDNAYIYILENKALTRKAFRDRNADILSETIPEELWMKNPLVRLAMENKEVTRAQDIARRGWALSGEQGVAAPLLTTSDQIIGVILIRRLDFFKYVPATFATLHALGRWGGMCLARAMHVHAAWEKTYRDEVTGFFSYAYFRKRLKAEFHKARRYQLPLYVVRFDIPALKDMPAYQRLAILRLASHSIEESSRDIDTKAIGETSGCFYTIMMFASSSEVERYKKQVEERFAEIRSQLSLPMSLALLSFRSALKQEHHSLVDFLASEEPW